MNHNLAPQWVGTAAGNDARLRMLNAALSVVVGSLLLTVSAKVQIPFWPVPLSMQTFVVLALGMVYGPTLGMATVMAYLAQGFVGLPVFVAGGGAAYFMGPTGGYLIGFAVAAYVVGMLAERGWTRHLLMAIAAAFIGNLVIYAFGLTWLSILLGDPVRAVAVGLMPFLLGAALKIAGAGALAWAFRRWRTE